MQGLASLDADIANYRLKHASSRLSVPVEESARYLHQVARIDGFAIVSRKDSGQLPLSKRSVEIYLEGNQILDTSRQQMEEAAAGSSNAGGVNAQQSAER